MPRWPVKEKETEQIFDLMEIVHLGDGIQKYLGVDIVSCTYRTPCGEKEAVVALTGDRPALCGDVSAAMGYIKHWKGRAHGHKRGIAQKEISGETGRPEEAQAKEEEENSSEGSDV